MTTETRFHKHWHLKVSKAGLVKRLLTKPLRHTKSMAKAEASAYPYGPCEQHSLCWKLSTLGILHRWTGMTLYFDEDYQVTINFRDPDLSAE